MRLTSNLRFRLILLLWVALIPAIAFVGFDLYREHEHVRSVIIFLVVGFVAAVALVCSAMALGAHIFIFRKVNALIDAVGRLCAGNLGARAELSPSCNELEQLGVAFDQLAESIEFQDEERKRSQKAVLESEQRLRTIFEGELERLSRQKQLILDAAEEGIIGLDLDGNIIFANRSSAEMLGYGPDELLGKDLHMLVNGSRPYGSLGTREEWLMHIASNHVACRVKDEILWKKDWTPFPVDYCTTPMLEAGKVTGAVITFRDVTERRKAEDAKIKLEAAIHEASFKPPAGIGHILLVDDEKAVMDVVREALEQLGYVVTARYSSLDALEAFRANPHRYDLVLTDQTMPQMTGIELTKEVLSIRPRVPSLLFTGLSEKAFIKRAMDAGITALLMKPILFKDLAETVRSALEWGSAQEKERA